MKKIKKILKRRWLGILFCCAVLSSAISGWAVPGFAQGISRPSMIANSPPPVYVAQAPTATFGNSAPVINAPPATVFDAYGGAGAGGSGQYPVASDPAYLGSPNSFYPQSNFPNNYAPTDPFNQSWSSNAYGSAKRFFQGFSFDYVWMANNSSRGLGLNHFDINATFAIPLFPNPEHPLLVTPGFGTYFWSGPDTTVLPPADLPPQTYDAYIGAAWNPMIIPGRLSAELSVKPGIYSDFSKLNTKSFRIPGRAVGIIHISPRFQGVLGIEYLHRNRIKLLPAGGVIWMPHERARYEFLFPNPRISHYLYNSPFTNRDVWWYLAGKYGTGSWTVDRLAGGDRVDVNDFRAMLGLEFKRTKMFDGARAFGQQHSAYIEVGYVFEREIYYRSLPPPTVTPSDTLMIGAGFRY